MQPLRAPFDRQIGLAYADQMPCPEDAKNFAPLGAVSALRETSVIFATLIGFFVLKEGNWKRRLGAAVLMVFGIAFIALNA